MNVARLRWRTFAKAPCRAGLPSQNYGQHACRLASAPIMGVALEVRLVVKHTFLEFVEAISASKSQRSRAVTDPSTFAPAGHKSCCLSTHEQASGLTPSSSSRAPAHACVGLSPVPEDRVETGAQACHREDIPKAPGPLEGMRAVWSLQPWLADRSLQGLMHTTASHCLLTSATL